MIVLDFEFVAYCDVIYHSIYLLSFWYAKATWYMICIYYSNEFVGVETIGIQMDVMLKPDKFESVS